MNQAYDSYPLFFDDVHKDLIWGDRTGTGAYRPLRRGAEAQMSGKCVLLVDDVITSGATLGECSRLLLTGGADRVVCATLCKASNQKRGSAETV